MQTKWAKPDVKWQAVTVLQTARKKSAEKWRPVTALQMNFEKLDAKWQLMTGLQESSAFAACKTVTGRHGKTLGA